jgi:hypothetical protein
MVTRARKVVPGATNKVKTVAGKTWAIPSPTDLVVPSNDFLDYYTIIHGTAGVGKTSLLASFPGSIIFQFEPQRRNIAARQVDFNVVPVAVMERGAENPWEKLLYLLDQAEEDPTIKVIVIDNVSECYKACEYDYLLKNDMESIPKKDFGVCRGQVNQEFERVFNTLKYKSKLGVVFTAHTKEREGELNTGTTESIYSPSCTSAVFEWLKKAMDFAFFLGYHNKRRAIHCRWDSIWTKCGIRDRFCNIKGQQLNGFFLPEDPSKGYETMLKAWNNKIKTGIIDSPESTEE